MKRIWAGLVAVLLVVSLAGCGKSSDAFKSELVKSREGSNAMVGYIFYDVDVPEKQWWKMSNDERDQAARDIVSQYDTIGTEAGYSDAFSIVTAYAGDDFAFGEEDSGDGCQITVFDTNTADGSRRITQ